MTEQRGRTAAGARPSGSSAIAEFALYQLARMLSRSEIAHSTEMKRTLQTADCNDEYRAAESGRVMSAARRLGLQLEGRVVLDLGCSDGALTVQYAADAAAVIGVDVDADAIARARPHPRVTYQLSTTTRLPLGDRSVDVILSFDVFEHVAEPGPLLAECRRVLRPGGRLLIGTWGWGHPFAPHLWSTMPVPWAHLLVSERTLLRACRRVYLSPWYVPTRHDFDADGQRKPNQYENTSISTAYLNKYYLRDFERVFEESGLRWTMVLEPFGAAKWTRLFHRSRLLREVTHGYFWAALTAPGP